ncbi:MAG: zinc ABC transporter substrate-binding protein [Lachnospiraceae bacterium]|nr:zinc ABC transporter substrate-binding protein [Lachnospiraceae bacterium]
MKDLRNSVAAALFACFCMFCLTACGNSGSSIAGEAADSEAGKLHIVTTIFPEYDWIREIVGEEAEHVELTLLLDNGVDLHSYQPTAEDIMKIASCDLFVYVGGESDEWVKDALAEATNEDMVVIHLLDVLGDFAKEEELVEGMEAEEDDGAREEADAVREGTEETDAEEDTEYDEHVWLSLKNAEICVGDISEVLAGMDAEHADAYKANAAAYVEKLRKLDAAYETAVQNAGQKTLLFGDRFPFRYLTDDYGLKYYAAFAGCSAETEASFETIAFLAGKVDELGLTTVMTIEGTDDAVAETIIKNTESKDQKILALDSMQSTTSKDIAEGETYLSIMQHNLEVLRQAFE